MSGGENLGEGNAVLPVWAWKAKEFFYALGRGAVWAGQWLWQRRGVQCWGAAVVAAVIVGGWFEGGRHIATGDVAPFLHQNLAAELGRLWNHAQSGAGSVTYAISRLYQVAFEAAVLGVGGGSATAQMIYFMALAAGAAGGTAYLVGSLVRNRGAILAAGLFGVVNPFMLTRMPNQLILWALLIGGLGGGILIRAGRGNIRRGGVKLAVLALAAAPLANNPPMMAVLFATLIYAGVVGILTGGDGAWRRVSRVLGVGAGLGIILNLWWLVPLYYTLFGGVGGSTVSAVVDVGSWSWTHRQNSLAAVFSMAAHHAWGFPQYYPATVAYTGEWLAASLYVIPLGVVAGTLYFGSRGGPRLRKLAWFFLGSIAVLLFLAKGLVAPFAGVNLWLYENVPGFWLLREPNGKLGPVLIAIYSMGLGMVLSHLWRPRTDKEPVGRGLFGEKRRAAGIVGGGLLCVAGLIAAWPIVTGSVIPKERPIFPEGHVEVPAEWYEIAEYINGEAREEGGYLPAGGGKVLTLPINDYYQMPTTWGYYGVDAIPAALLEVPLVNHQPGGYYAEEAGYQALLDEMTNAVWRGDEDRMVAVAERLGVRHIILRHDIDTEMVEGRTFADPAELKAGIEEMGLDAVYRNSVADIYRVGEGRGLAGYVSAVTSGGIQREELGAVLTSLRRGEVLLGERSGKGSMSGWDVVSVVETDTAEDGSAVPLRGAGGYVSLWAEDGAVHADGQVVGEGAAGDVVATRHGRAAGGAIRDGVILGKDPVRAWVPQLGSGEVFSRSAAGESQNPDCDDRGCRWRVDLTGSGSAGDLYLLTLGGEGAEVDSAPCVTTSRWYGAGSECWELTPAVGVALVPAADIRQYLIEAEAHLLLAGPGRVEVELRRATGGSVSIERLANGRPVELDPGRGVEPGPESGEAGVVTLGEWGSLGDCNKVDDASFEEAGLSLWRTGGGWQLGADRHSACVAQQIEISGEVPLLVVEMQITRMDGGPGRVCLYAPEVRRCLRETTGATAGAGVGVAHLFKGVYEVPTGVSRAELFLYADAESRVGRTEVRYEKIEVTADAGTKFLIREEGQAGGAGGGQIVVLSESYSEGWILETREGGQVAAEHFLADGWANGWVLEDETELEDLVVRFGPQRYADLGVRISLAGITALGLFEVLRVARPKREKRAQSPAETAEAAGSGSGQDGETTPEV